MTTSKLHSGDVFPTIEAPVLGGGTVDISKPEGDATWRMIVVYRGKHCPLCTKYLTQLEGLKGKLADAGVDIIAVSADSEEQAAGHAEKLEVSFPIAHSLTLDQMQTMGLYVSNPRSAEETDHLFPEPGLFVVNDAGKLHMVDISNHPFVRPDLESVVGGIGWIRNPDNNYPIRGTYK